MGKIEIDHTGSGSGITLSSDGTNLLLGGTAVGGGGGSPDLFADNDVSATAPSATGDNSVAIGPSSEANSADATAFGYRSEAKASKAVAIGEGRAGGASATAISIGTTSTAYGATGTRSVAMGYQAKATGLYSFALGANSVSTGQDSFAVGKSLASTSQGFAVQINNNTTSYGASGVFGSTAIGNTAKATGSVAIALGQGSIASGSKALAFGTAATASSANSVAIGYNSVANVADGVAIGGSGKQVKISGTYTLPTADGTNGQVLTTDGSGAVTFATPASGGGGADLYAANESSPTAQPSATGTNAIAIGDGAISSNTGSFALAKSRASANLSFAAAIANNTTSKGATGNQCIAMGYGAYAPGSNSVAIAINSNSGTGSNNLAMMRGSITGGKSNSLSIGYNSRCDQANATALGYHSVAISQGKFAYQNNSSRPAGQGQMGLVNLSGRTTDATPKVLSNNDGSHLDYAQLLIPNNTSYTFTGVISSREKASEGTDVGGWEVKGVIRREGSASTTTLVNSIINDINVPTGWAVAVSADTTNGALSVTVTGVASTNITWIATIYTSEVTYA